MRYLALIVATCVFGGCTRTVLMLNPRTGETMTCRQSSLNPWSQHEACVGSLIGQGWKKLDASQERGGE